MGTKVREGTAVSRYRVQGAGYRAHEYASPRAEANNAKVRAGEASVEDHWQRAASSGCACTLQGAGRRARPHACSLGDWRLPPPRAPRGRRVRSRHRR